MVIGKIDSGSRKKVVVGVTGKLDSIVAAYLLKKQGFEVLCIGIQFHSAEKEKLITDRYYRNRDEDFTMETDNNPAPFIGVSIIENLSKVKELCDRIGLPFYAVDASGEYQNMLTDKIVAAKIGGISFCPEVYVTQLIFETLYQKSIKLKADYISTGHYAKVVKNQSTKSYNIFVANDTISDQSSDFCLLNQDILSKVILPFSEMRKVEVSKIGSQMLKLEFMSYENAGKNLMAHESLPKFTQERSPYVMIKEGVIIDQRQDKVITDHDGIHHFYHGQNDLKTKGGMPIEKAMTILEINYGNGTIIAGDIEDLKVKIIVLKEVQFQGKIDLTKPFAICLKVNGGKNLLKGTLYFNNNSYCHIVLDEIHNELFVRGDYVAFYNKAGVSGRLIGGGQILKAGEIDNGYFYHLPRYEDEDDREVENQIDVYQLKF